MPGKTQRSSNLELLRILCMLLIIGDHLTGQGGIADYTTLPSSFAFCLIGCGSRIACSVFILIGGWFLCEQPYKTRRPLSLWLSLWLYTVPVTLLCRLAGLDVSFGALRWAAFPASTRQLWFISDYLLLLLCVPLLNRVLRGLPRTAHRGLLAVLAVPMILYPTLFGENGIVSDTAWMFLYEYLLAAYLRRYHAAPRAWHKWGVALLVVAGISRRHGFSTHGWRRSGSSRTSNFRGASGRSTWPRCRSGCSCC